MSVFKTLLFYLHFLCAPSVIAALFPKGVSIRYGRQAAETQQQYCSFIAVSFICLKVFAVTYCYISAYLGDGFIVSTGLLLTLGMIITGIFINQFFYRTKPKSELDKKHFEKDRPFLVGMSALICAVDCLMINTKVSWFLISVLLGKYFWFDFGLLVSCDKMREQIQKDWTAVNFNAKEKSCIFAALILFSDFAGFLVEKCIIPHSSFRVSLIASLLLSSIYLFIYGHIMKNIDQKKKVTRISNNKQKGE